MAYAQNDIREVWDKLGKPKVFEFSCLEFESIMYIPYMAEVVIARDIDKLWLQDFNKLCMQYPVNKVIGNVFYGAKAMAIDIDVTYICNLACANCNRASHIKTLSKGTNKDIAFFEDFINKYKKYGKALIVKLVGGEPTLHPKLRDIMAMLNEHFTVWVLTNGIKPYEFPDYVYVENSAKIKDVNPEFHATYMAPIDDELFNDITNEQYSKGCDMLQCGYGYSEDGLHPCSIGMALNRILKLKTGYANKQECDKNKADYLAATCKMCGLFKKLGSHNVDKSQFKRVTENAYSKSWEFMKQFK